MNSRHEGSDGGKKPLQPADIPGDQIHTTEVQRRLKELEGAKSALDAANRQMQAVLDAATEVSIIATDRDGLITLYNKGSEKMLGYSAAEMVGICTPLRIHLESEITERAEYLSRELGKAVTGFEVFVAHTRHHGAEIHEWTYVRKDGTHILVNLAVTVIRDSKGDITGYLGIAEDITRRKSVENQLLENKELLSTIMNSLPSPVFFKDGNGVYQDCNEAFCAFLGLPKERIVGATVFDIAPPELALIYHRADIDLMKQQGTQVYEAAVRYADGTNHDVLIYKSAILLKGSFRQGLVGVMLDITERKRAESALRNSEELFRLLFEKSGDANLLLDGSMFVDCNEATVRMLGCADKNYVLNAHPADISPEYQPDGRLSSEKADEMIALAFERGSHRFEWLHRRMDGGDLPVEVLLTAIPMHGKWLLHTAWRDISDRKRAEEEKEKLAQRLLQSQKMESIGRLAGGVAHDFNNLLTPIMGYAEMIRTSLAPTDLHHKRISGILDAAVKARDLTRQLLAFSRKQVLEMKVLDLNQVIESFATILERTIREDVTISLKLDPNLGSVLADRMQTEQIVMNLAINAQDAMPAGGALMIETANVTLNGTIADGVDDVPDGAYVMLAISDSGHGMDAETMNHIFEPFYTTKEQGKGTGLGLATVFGIVKQHGGTIFVYSEPDMGTTFKLYFPRIDEPPAETESTGDDDSRLERHSAVILLVEDNPMVREMSRELLTEQGYTILMADGPDQAAVLFRELGRPVDLLLSDVIMPVMSGPALYETLKAIQPDLKVLYMSGYTESVVAHHGMLDGNINYLQKPFTTSTMVRKVEEAMGRRHASGNGGQRPRRKGNP
jgi:two-component system cell cycle sensor histidine kinase/response regulator CckA